MAFASVHRRGGRLQSEWFSTGRSNWTASAIAEKRSANGVNCSRTVAWYEGFNEFGDLVKRQRWSEAGELTEDYVGSPSRR